MPNVFTIPFGIDVPFVGLPSFDFARPQHFETFLGRGFGFDGSLCGEV